MKISWFPKEMLDQPGQLGLTHLPGGYRKTRDDDLDALHQQQSTHLFCLVEEDELRWLSPPESIQDRRQAVQARGITFFHEPIEDFTAPTMAQARRIVDAIHEALRHKSRVVLHCWAGLGRAGTLAACILVSQGMSPQDAITSVRHIREGAIQSDSQLQCIHRFSSLL